MAQIPLGTKFVGGASTYPMVERRSAMINDESQSYTMQDITDTVAAGLPAPTNPTDTYIPYNDGGVFEDSPLRTDNATNTVFSSYNLDISRTTSQGVPVLGLYTNANGGFGATQPDSAIQWGFENQDPMFGPESWKDCSIANLPPPGGFYGSAIGIKTQKSYVFVPGSGDTQTVGLALRPWSFITSTGGVSIYGGNANAFENSYLNVIGDDGFPPSYKMSSASARFDGQMSAIVVPKVPAANQAMMSGENGMILYNTDTNKFQGYANGVWVDLH